MKLFSVRNTCYLFIAAVLIFMGVQIRHINTKLSSITTHTSRFSVDQITSELPYNAEWDVPHSEELTQFINMVTQQSFTFLGKGYQAIAFGSEDGEYVLKFFFQYRFKKDPFLHRPMDYLFNQEFRDAMEKKQLHRREIFTSSKQAFLEFPEESGIIYVHLNTTDKEMKSMKLKDSTGVIHRFKGDIANFVVQKRAEYILPTLTKLMKAGEVEQAKARIDQIFDLLLSLAKKGFLDGDFALIRNNNIGFTKDRAIYIDTGHIVKRENVNVLRRMEFEFDKRLPLLYSWLRFSYPELADYYNMRKEQILESLGKKPSSPAPENSA